MHICAVNFRRRRGGTVLKEIFGFTIASSEKRLGISYLSSFRVRSLILATAYICKALSCKGRGASSGNGSK